MRLILKKSGYEVWAKFDPTARVWELFTEEEGECYVGCADTLAEAHAVANHWLAEQLAV